MKKNKEKKCGLSTPNDSQPLQEGMEGGSVRSLNKQQHRSNIDVKNFVLEHKKESNNVKKTEVVQRGKESNNVNRRRKQQREQEKKTSTRIGEQKCEKEKKVAM